MTITHNHKQNKRNPITPQSVKPDDSGSDGQVQPLLVSQVAKNAFTRSDKTAETEVKSAVDSAQKVSVLLQNKVLPSWVTRALVGCLRGLGVAHILQVSTESERGSRWFRFAKSRIVRCLNLCRWGSLHSPLRPVQSV